MFRIFCESSSAIIVEGNDSIQFFSSVYNFDNNRLDKGEVGKMRGGVGMNLGLGTRIELGLGKGMGLGTVMELGRKKWWLRSATSSEWCIPH